MRTLIKIGFSLLLLGFVLIGLVYSGLRAQGSSGPANREGRVVAEETRTLEGDVRTVDLSGPFNMTLRQGPVASLVVSGEKRLLEHVRTEQHDGDLEIKIKGMVMRQRVPLKLTLVLPSLEGVHIKGSGKSTVNGFSGERLEVQLSGSGKVTVNGRFKEVSAGMMGSGELDVNAGNCDQLEGQLRGSGKLTVVGECKTLDTVLTGSGDIDARHLTVQQATISLQGSGTATLHAVESVDVTVRGNGDVFVYGAPKSRNISRTGSGEVLFK
ncbi:MAG: head GIN domain-containing protein [Pseudomonadota bacterium]